ncbi:MAG: hypothetical protein QOJ99_854 [Bryobacterales bacterium]|jgi:hypothetical protein|nr:hypothetical protein [Bryobacterales bacterium]
MAAVVVRQQRVVATRVAAEEVPRPAEEAELAVAVPAAIPDGAVAAVPTREARERRLPAPEIPAGNTDTLFLTAEHLSRNAGKPS